MDLLGYLKKYIASANSLLKTDLFADTSAPFLRNLWNKFTDAHMTDAQSEQLAAQWDYKQKEYEFTNAMQRQNVVDQYALQVQGMQNSGLNPALMYSGGRIGEGVGSPQASSSPVLSSSSNGLGEILSLVGNIAMQQAVNRTQKDIARIGADAQKQAAETSATAHVVASENAAKPAQTSADAQARYLNLQSDILELSKDSQVRQAKANADLTEKQVETCLATKTNLLATAKEAIERATSESDKRKLYVAEAALNHMQAWQIGRLTTALDSYYRGNAAQAFSQSARLDYLFSSGELQAIVEEAKASARSAGLRVGLDELKYNPQNFIQELVGGALVALDAVKPVVITGKK